MAANFIPGQIDVHDYDIDPALRVNVVLEAQWRGVAPFPLNRLVVGQWARGTLSTTNRRAGGLQVEFLRPSVPDNEGDWTFVDEPPWRLTADQPVDFEVQVEFPGGWPRLRATSGGEYPPEFIDSGLTFRIVDHRMRVYKDQEVAIHVEPF